jgi:uncharacterized membrane protein
MASITDRFQTFVGKLASRTPWRQMLVFAALVLVALWMGYTPAGLLGKADAVGYAVCHRIDARSFHLGDRQVPVCARCIGQYLGAMLSLGTLFLRRPRRTGNPTWPILGVLILFALAYAVDGLNSYLHLIPNLSRFYLYEPSNPTRLLTGTGLGIGMGVMLFTAFNQTMWKVRDRRPVLSGFRDLAFLMVLAILVDFLVLTENPLILYPLALVSATGVVVLLMLVYTMVVVMVFKQENRMAGWRDLVYPLMAGFIIGLSQVAVLDLVRFLLTGTWSGFHFG